ncbi:hypothetical protein K227x_59210 [Rubripirellula lacrimiformis]|uniref:Uncharacterized protein n=1 Tax=Rubripirellula lacrimiformis TaxID=1930273 RepID=A0A517NK31_9BACT|nr:trypsin-like peptidase domain-containing protein [Rubripirellula lacrimiformis]QDT07494.1 hypothetical protein K227x_59210 [Rubripirellula lacrimiformis]
MRQLTRLIPALIFFTGFAATCCGESEFSLRVLKSSDSGNVKRAGTALLCSYKDEQYLVTAYHVAYKAKQLALGHFDGKEHEDLQNFVQSSFWCKPEVDLCIFKCKPDQLDRLTEQTGDFRARVFDIATPKKGMPVRVAGNPRITLFQDQPYKRTSYEPPNIVSMATIAELSTAGERLDELVVPAASNTTLVMLGSFDIVYGYSGGPIVSGEKNVVGVLVGGDPDKGIVTWGIPLSYFGQVIDQGVKLELSNTLAWPGKAFAADAYGSDSSELVLRFPIEHSAPEERFLEGVAWVSSSVRLSESGRLDGIVTVGTDEFLKGFHGEVIVFLMDDAGNVLWTTEKEHRYGVPVGISKVREDEVWTENVPRHILPRVRRISILQRYAPTPNPNIEDFVSDLLKDGALMKTLRESAKSLQRQIEN